MCGIHGLLGLADGFRPDPGWAEHMGDVTTHRGPDDAGRYADNEMLLGMRRLSIIDLEGGQQPIANEDSTVWVVCNGEIYNFRELRARLEGQGHTFRTASDTEVIVHLYEEHGDQLVQHLDGMYGFALWDARRRRLLLARDRLGIKPLYYHSDGRRLAFASEAKAILALPDVRAEVDPAALEQYLGLGYVPAPYSMFRNIHKLPPASMLICDRGRIEIRSYWQFEPRAEEALTAEDWIEQLLEQLRESVVSQMVSDVPLGAFLSGGIDSSTVVAFMAGASSTPIRTYAIGFEGDGAEQYYNELPHARRIARLFGTQHREILVRPDVADLLPKLIWHLDEPVADSAFITTYLVSRFAREDVKVILSGVGGDELFGGYRRYLGPYYDRRFERIPAWLRRQVLVPAARRLPSDRHSPLTNLSRHVRSYVLATGLPPDERYRSYVRVFGDTLLDQLMDGEREPAPDAIQAAFAKSNGQDALSRAMHVDLQTQLPDDLLFLTDRMSMATSLECRVPLLDHRLVELTGRMPSRMKVRGRELKHILKQAMRRHLPQEILQRRKRGFGAPMGAWLKRELKPLLRHVLSRESIRRRGFFRPEAVERTMDLHEAGREDHTDHLLALLNLELWARIYLDGAAPVAVSGELQALQSP